MPRTSIACDTETKKKLNQIKRDSETWNDTLRRLAESNNGGSSESQAHTESVDTTDKPQESDSITRIKEEIVQIRAEISELEHDTTERKSEEMKEQIRMAVRSGIESRLPSRH